MPSSTFHGPAGPFVAARRLAPGLLYATFLVGASFFVTAEISAENSKPGVDWPRFRGPEADGAIPQTDLAESWADSAPKILWKRPLGEGFSSISVVGDRLYTLFADGEEDLVAAFRAADGEEIWRFSLGPKFRENFGNGPRSTPTVVDGTVFALGSQGRLVALDTAEGKLLWQKELQQAYPILASQTLVAMAPTMPGPQLPVFGYSASPLVTDGLVVLQTGAGQGRSLVALDPKTGEERWTALDDEIGYSTPLRTDFGQGSRILVLLGADLVALTLDGKVDWRFSWAPTPSQPVLVGQDRILVSTVNDIGAKLVRVKEGTGDERIETVWAERRFRNNWNSSLYYDGHLYGFDNATFRCVDAETGEFRWSKRGLGQGTLLRSGDQLLVFSDRGKLHLVEATAEAFRDLGSLEVLSGRSWTAPSLAGGVIYVRNHEEMAAIDLTGGAS